jgi:hypothetical protein
LGAIGNVGTHVKYTDQPRSGGLVKLDLTRVDFEMRFDAD